MWWWLTFGLVMFPWGPPPYAGLVLIQIKESDQSFLLPFQFGHLSASLHGAHAPLHCRRAQVDTVLVQSEAASPSVSLSLPAGEEPCAKHIWSGLGVKWCLRFPTLSGDLSKSSYDWESIQNSDASVGRHENTRGIPGGDETSGGFLQSTRLWDYRLGHMGI